MNDFAYAVVSENFFEGPFTNSSITGNTQPTEKGSYAYNQTYARGGFADGDHPFQNIIVDMANDHRSHPEHFRNLSTLECLKAYNQPFEWRPNFFLVTSKTNISYLKPMFVNKTATGDHLVANNQNQTASLLAWALRSPNTVREGICEFSNSEIARSCDKLSEWTDEMAKEWTYTFGVGFPIDYCVQNVANITEASKPFEECHLQCSPHILIGTSSLATNISLKVNC
jgi:hypothetical protein